MQLQCAIGYDNITRLEDAMATEARLTGGQLPNILGVGDRPGPRVGIVSLQVCEAGVVSEV